MKKPTLPTQFTEQDPVKATVMITHRLGAYIGGLALLSFLIASSLPLALKVIAGIPLAFFTAIGLHNLALLGHEGTHFTLAGNRLTSARIGTFFSAIVPLHFNTGFTVSHAIHHWHTNTEKDPDLKVFDSLHGFWRRMLLARSRATRAYLQETIRLAQGKMNSPNLTGLKDNELFGLARLNLGLSVIFLFIHVAVIALWPSSVGVSFICVYAIAVFMSGLRPYLEHAGTDSNSFSLARTFKSPLLDYTFGTINYHLAHHMYPKVPAYNLPRLHAWLEQSQAIDKRCEVSESSFADLFSVLQNSPYGRIP